MNDIFGYLSGDLNLELKAGRSMLSFRIQGKYLYVSIVATEKERKEREVTAKRKKNKSQKTCEETRVQGEGKSPISF